VASTSARLTAEIFAVLADRDRGVRPAELGERVPGLRAEAEHHRPAQKDAERDGGEHRGEHRLARHAPHERAVDEQPRGEREHGGHRDRHERLTGEKRRRRVQAVGREHHQLAVSQRQHPAHPVDQHVAAADQRIDRGEDEDVDR
jgi:hypothetical protein